MAAFVDNSLLDVSEINLMAITLNIHTTPVYIDPSKTIMTPYSQANELVFGQSTGQQYIAMSLCPFIYNNKQGINSANHLVSIMNIGNQLYSSLQSFLMQTELPTLLNVFETDYELQYSESYTASRQKINTSRIFMTGNYEIA